MRGRHAGFTLIEFSIASLASMVVLAATFTLMNQMVQSNKGVGDIMATQSSVRVAMNTISRDITMAGTGLPSGSVAIPNGASADPIVRPGMAGFDSPENELESAENILPIVSTGAADGPTVAIATDVLTMFTTNPDTPTWTVTSVATFSDRYEVKFSSAVNAGILKLSPGDLLLFNNNYGSVLGCVSSIAMSDNTVAIFSDADAMGVNQPAAENGNLGSLKNPGTSPATYPPTTGLRVSLITYYIDYSNETRPRLMRAVNAAVPDQIAEDIENLQFSFDTWDESTSTQTANVKATANPNQIRSVSVSITGRSSKRKASTNNFYRFSLISKINVRNSTFRNRYAGS